MRRSIAATAFLTGLIGHGAFAQCVMCFRTASAQQAERARILNAGILIMLIPPVVILGGFLLLFYLRRKTYAAPDDASFDKNPPSLLSSDH